MEIFQTLGLFILGFYILIKGSKLLIDGASSIARRLNVSSWLIGLTIVGIGTSIPEFSLTVLANLRQSAGIALGTIIGSNIVNILFILGAAALITPLRFKNSWIRRDLPWNILAVGAAYFLLRVNFSDKEPFIGITRLEGALLCILFFVWLYIAIKNGTGEDEPMEFRIVTLPLSFLMIVGGIVGIFLGGEWVLNSTLSIARIFGISEAIMGLTTVGVGTSLPELAVTWVAAFRGQTAIAVGNIVGSNIFDFLLILGFSGILRPVAFSSEMNFDIAVTLISATLLYIALLIGERHVLGRWQGAVFVALYLAYLFSLILRKALGTLAGIQ